MALRMLMRSIAARVPAAAPALGRAAACPGAQSVLQLGRVAAGGLAREAGGAAPAARSFAVSALSRAADADLAAALKEEIAYEQEHNKKSVKDFEAPDGWTVSEEPGDSVVKLTRKHGGEDVLVEFSVNNQASDPIAGPLGDLEGEDEELEDESQIDMAISFDVTVAKGGKSLSFELASDGNYLQINHVTVGSSEDALSEDAYDGPVFEELDEKVQEAFVRYLAERGVDAALGEYLMVAADAKEQAEYARWLADVRSFVSA